jgi:hypothetical protein
VLLRVLIEFVFELKITLFNSTKKSLWKLGSLKILIYFEVEFLWGPDV